MYFLALATDYDGTIAHHGRVDEPTLEALERFKKTGRRLILVTGRHLPDLKTVFPPMELFDLVVAENGALLYNPATQKERCLAAPRRPAAGSGPGDRRHLGAAPGHRPRRDPPDGPGAADHLQQGCGHGAAREHEQGRGHEGGAR